jgi:hypothetical protein
MRVEVGERIREGQKLVRLSRRSGFNAVLGLRPSRRTSSFEPRGREGGEELEAE